MLAPVLNLNLSIVFLSLLATKFCARSLIIMLEVVSPLLLKINNLFSLILFPSYR